MGFIAVLVAAVATFVLGAVWYGVFGAKWMAAVGMTKEDQAKMPKTIYAVSLVLILMVVGMMRHAFAMSGIDGLGAGLVSGLGIGLFFISPWICINYLYSNRPKDLWWIDCGYAISGCALSGAILGLL